MAHDTRRSTAAQFFADDDDVTANEDKPTYERVVELLNEASLLKKDAERVNNLNMVKELIINKEPALLDNFLDEMLAYQTDRSQDVKKSVVGFIEEACKTDNEILPKVMMNLNMMLQEDNVAVIKRIILAMGSIYKTALQWVSRAKTITEEMEQAWQSVLEIKKSISGLIESDNDGVRTHAVKFLESVAITLTPRTPESDIPKKQLNDISLDQIVTGKMVDVDDLAQDGKKVLDLLLDFMTSQHLSSVNLMTCMGSLTSIAKQRPQYMARVVLAYEALNVNLPPTLAKSQVSSVRKNLKMQLLSLLKHMAAYDLQTQIATLLTDLGATHSEVMKNMPKIDESRKRKMEADAVSLDRSSSSNSKKAKIEIPLTKEEKDDDKDDDEDYALVGIPSVPSTSSIKKVKSDDHRQTAIEMTADDLVPRLTAQNVADLVLLSMVMLPDTMPAQFQSTYTPIAAAGTEAQVNHLARLLATQLTAVGLGKGHEETQAKQPPAKSSKPAVEEKKPESKEEPMDTSKQAIQTIGTTTATVQKEAVKESKLPKAPPQPVPPPRPFQMPATRKGIKVFKLAAVTRPMDHSAMDSMALAAFNRVLKSEKAAIYGEATSARIKILTTLVSQYGGTLKDELQQFIFADLRNRADLAMAWIYQEYANYQGYNSSNPGQIKLTIASYDECITRLLNGLLERPDQKEGLFSRLMLEAPCITHNAIMVLRKYCQDESRIFFGMSTLKELILKRPAMKLEFLDVLLDFTTHEKTDVRQNAIRVAKNLHQMAEFTGAIEKSALYYLKFLLQAKPPVELFGTGKAKADIPESWTEDTIKLCLYLYLALLPINHTLIHELAVVYTASPADIKRTILRVLEQPVKGMGMQSPELLTLVESCPKGAETLVTRIIHILTDKTAPSPELVERVRDLYQKRVSDVRFLIPVLTGLQKSEVIVALPKLIKLNPVVVREVFNRLLGAHVTSQDSNYTSPLTPTELLIALHNVDSQKCDMKTIIRATNLCFGEKNIYTQEVLAIAMQQLMEQTPLPTLFMRTVIQSLAMYPKLIGHVMNILTRLIAKQVWRQKKVWEGFVKCCQRIKPQSFQVLLSLPPPQLKNVFEICPDLREPLLAHVMDFTAHQKAHIPVALMEVLQKPPEVNKAVEQDKKQMEEQRRAEQDKLYQQKLEEERMKQAAMSQQSPIQTLTSVGSSNIQVKIEPEEGPPRVPSTIPPSMSDIIHVKEEDEVSRSSQEKDSPDDENHKENRSKHHSRSSSRASSPSSSRRRSRHK